MMLLLVLPSNLPLNTHARSIRTTMDWLCLKVCELSDAFVGDVSPRFHSVLNLGLCGSVPKPTRENPQPVVCAALTPHREVLEQEHTRSLGCVTNTCHILPGDSASTRVALTKLLRAGTQSHRIPRGRKRKIKYSHRE